VFLMPVYFLFIVKGVFPESIVFHLLQLVFLASYVYCHIYVSRLLKSVELGKRVQVADFFGDFILILFFPIGVWIIQPRVNKLFQ
jgi:hypothetical protein